ncbi:MAG TPA: FAD-dependent oxidoreductase [Xanthobacteraceae bacterium]|nr:FAD-dependent oxidoreductase [Xanthobacteraceae bacterium]
MAEPLAPDICVIGADAGGLAVAAAAAALGVPTVLIEKGGMGDAHVKKSGRVPAKALIAAAERANAFRNGARFGAKSARFGMDFAAVNAHLHDVIGAVAPNAERARFTGLGVHVISGTARFTDAETVAVDGVAVRARRFVIATGSKPVLPAIAGLLDAPYFTSETVSDLVERPRHLIVIGAGAVGLELAQAFRRLGSEVTVLEAATPLADEDRECAAVVRDAIEREGITLRTGVEIAKVSRSLAKTQVILATPAGTQTIEGSHLLVAAGRRANLDELELDVAGIRSAPHGIIVDHSLRTTNKRVYAVGGVVDRRKFDALATYHAGLVIRHALFRLPVRADTRAIPRVIFTDPELAQVGLTEDEARARKGVIRILRWPYRENDRAQAERRIDGHIKVITDRRGGILGATIVGAQAGESIATWTLAIRQRLNIRAFAGLAVSHPSYAELGTYAAFTFFTRNLTSRWVRRIIGWLRRYG